MKQQGKYWQHLGANYFPRRPFNEVIGRLFFSVSLGVYFDSTWCWTGAFTSTTPITSTTPRTENFLSASYAFFHSHFNPIHCFVSPSLQSAVRGDKNPSKYGCIFVSLNRCCPPLGVKHPPPPFGTLVHWQPSTPLSSCPFKRVKKKWGRLLWHEKMASWKNETECTHCFWKIVFSVKGNWRYTLKHL